MKALLQLYINRLGSNRRVGRETGWNVPGTKGGLCGESLPALERDGLEQVSGQDSIA